MVDLLKVSPTKGNLLRLTEELAGVRSRHDLLDRKREVLIRELMNRLELAAKLEEKRLEYFRAAHEAIEEARIRMGGDRIDRIVLSPTVSFEVDVVERTVMGLKIPSIAIRIEPSAVPPYGLAETSAALDRAREKWRDVLEFLSESSEVFVAVWRLAMELRKTERQVNALESTIIPRYSNTIRHIASRLEEEEREDIVYAKKIKEMRQRSDTPE